MTLDPGAILCLTMPLAPLVAVLVIGAGGRALAPAIGHWPVTAGCILSGAAAAGLLAVLVLHTDPGAKPPVLLETLYRWYGGDDAALTVQVAIRADALTLIMIVGVSLATAAASICAAAGDPVLGGGRGLLAAIAAVQFGTVMLLAADNLVQMFVFWQVLGILAWLLVRGDAVTKPAMESSGRVLLTLLAGDVLLLGAIVICGTQLGTVFWSELAPAIRAYLADGPQDAIFAHRAALLGLAGFLLTAGVVVRCGQFPAFGWLTDAGRGVAGAGRPVDRGPHGPHVAAREILVQTIAMPLGAYVVIRWLPLLATAPDARWMLLVLGSLTCVLAAAVAVCERDLAQILLFTTASQVGLMLCGAVSGVSTGVLGAVVLWNNLLTARTALLLLLDPGKLEAGTRRVTPTRISGWLALTLLVSGLGGQHAIVASLWSAAEGDPTRMLLAGLAGTGILLTAGALTFAWLDGGSRNAAAVRLSEPADAGTPSTGPAVPLVLVGVAAVVSTVLLVAPGWLIGFFSASAAGQRAEVVHDGPAVIVTLLLAALGAIAGWLFWIRRGPAAVAGTASATDESASLVRLACRRFYIDEVLFLLVVFPVRAAAQVVRFFEWLIVDGVTAGLPRRVPHWAGRYTRPLESGAGQFAALAIVLAATVLLVVLIRG